MFKRLFEKFLGKTKFFFGGNTFLTGMELPAPSTNDYLQSFNASSLVHSCTQKIGEKMSTIEYELYQLNGLKANYVEQHELLDLLAKPNPIITGSGLVEITSIYLSLLGDCYWYKARDYSGKIIELWLMRPDLVSIVPSSDGSVTSYKFRSSNREENYPAEDVIHFKEPNPLSDYYGYSPVKAAMEIIRADVYAKKWNTKFFYNSARPDAILTTTQKIGKEDREEIKKRWTNQYGGWENAQKVAVLSHGLDYKQVSISQKDMDFANMRIANRDDILMALGVPKSVIGVTDDVNRASADAGIYVFLSETIKPKMEKLVDALNQFFVVEFEENLFLTSVDPTPEDNSAKDDHYVKAHNRWLTTNEVRMEQGYDPIEGGDSLYLLDKGEKTIIGGKQKAENYFIKKKEQKLKDIYRKAMRGRKTLRMRDELINKITIQVSKNLKNSIDEKKSSQQQDERDLIWKKFDEKLKGNEEKFKKLIVSLFSEQNKRAKDKIKTKKNKDLLDFKKEVKIFIRKSKPLFKEILKEAGEEAEGNLSKKIKKDFDISDPMTAKWIDEKAMKFGEEVNETTIKKLKKELSIGVLEGESIQQLKKRVDTLFVSWYKGRGETIARTEVLSSNNAGTLFGYQQSGVVNQKEWLSARDARTRPAHGAVDGQKVNIDKAFIVGGEKLEYPGDPNGSASNIVNCRCTILPIISDKKN
jgi:HK97 family phage portal protein